MRKDQLCPYQDCGRPIKGGKLQRHIRRSHLGATVIARVSNPVNEHREDVTRCTRVTDVLSQNGISNIDLDSLSIEGMDRLSNLRLNPLAPSKGSTPWLIHLPTPLSDMPSLLDLLWRLNEHGGRDVWMGGQAWCENEMVDYDKKQRSAWLKTIVAGQRSNTRVLNLRLKSLLPAGAQESLCHLTQSLARDTYGLERGTTPDVHELTANITPRLSVTHVHHDSIPHVSVAVGQEGAAVKLWLVWPSTEADKLARCYSDTNLALSQLENGRFLVQMPGEAVVVPANAPHAVLALNSCFLVGHTFSPGVCDPPSVHLDIRSGMDRDEACRMTLKSLSAGLEDPTFRDRYVYQFMKTWTMDAIYIKGQAAGRDYFPKIVAIWAQDIQRRSSCAWCIHSGLNGETFLCIDAEEHAKAHLECRRPLA